MRKASDAEQKFATPLACTRCSETFRAEVITRRVYETAFGLALGAFCQRCAQALSPGGVADTEVQAQLERSALAQALPQGRA
jgi:hypothetical protein